MLPALSSVRSVCLLLSATILAAFQGGQTFTGTITDSECANADHSRMRMGPTDPECIAACLQDHGSSYVLYDGTDTFELSDQDAPAKFAARRVRVTGTLDRKTKTIHVESITAAP